VKRFFNAVKIFEQLKRLQKIKRYIFRLNHNIPYSKKVRLLSEIQGFVKWRDGISFFISLEDTTFHLNLFSNNITY